MNDHHDLLDQVLAGERLENLRRATLENGLLSLRRRRRKVRTLRLGLLVALPLLAATLLLWRGPLAEGHRYRSTPLASREAVISPPSAREAKVINDEDLFALFPNRPMALIGKPGHQEVVFLDERVAQAGRQ